MKEDAEALGRDTEHGKEEATPLAASAVVRLPAEDEGLPHLVAGEAVGAAETAAEAQPPDSSGPTFRISIACRNPSTKSVNSQQPTISQQPNNSLLLSYSRNFLLLSLSYFFPIFFLLANKKGF